jgi:hypothetical protein
MEEGCEAQFQTSNTSKQEAVTEGQSSCTEHAEDPTNQESPPEETAVQTASASSTLKDTVKGNTDKSEVILQGLLVEKKDTSSAFSVQYESDTEDSDQKESAAKKIPVPVKQVHTTADVKLEQAAHTSGQTQTNNEANIQNVIARLEDMKLTLKEMQLTLGEVLPEIHGQKHAHEQSQEQEVEVKETSYVGEEVECASNTTMGIRATEDRNRDTDEQIIAKMEEMRIIFKKIISSFEKSSDYSEASSVNYYSEKLETSKEEHSQHEKAPKLLDDSENKEALQQVKPSAKPTPKQAEASPRGGDSENLEASQKTTSMQEETSGNDALKQLEEIPKDTSEGSEASSKN